MSKVNLDVQDKLEKRKQAWVAGALAGMEADHNKLPGFFNKPYYMMTPQERGFIFGWSLVVDEEFYK